MAIVWADPDGRALAVALDRLIAGTFRRRVTVWRSTREIDGPDWRGDVLRAARGADACILALGRAAATDARLLYQAGACFRDGATFAIGCGADPAQLQNGPLAALRLRDAHDPAQVRSVVRAVGLAAGESAASFEAGFTAAAVPFQHAVRQLAGSVEARRAAESAAAEAQERSDADERRWAARRRVATIVALAASVIVIAAAPWLWALWPAAAQPAACGGGSGARQAQCEWERLLAGNGRTPADPDLAARVLARPFAVVAEAPGCDDAAGAVDVRIAGQGAAGDGWRLPVVFARHPADSGPGTFSAATVAHGDRIDVLAPGRCVAIAGGALQLRAVATLGQAPICSTLRETVAAFRGHPGVATQLAAFLAPFGLEDPGPLRARLADWLTLCRTP